MYSGLCLPGDQRGAAVQALGPQVLHQVVRVVDEERRGAGVGGAVDRGVDLVLEQRPAALVLRAVEHLLPVDDARRALDVGRDEDFHGSLRGSLQAKWQAARWRAVALERRVVLAADVLRRAGSAGGSGSRSAGGSGSADRRRRRRAVVACAGREPGHRAQQPLRVGVARVREQLARSAPSRRSARGTSRPRGRRRGGRRPCCAR